MSKKKKKTYQTTPKTKEKPMIIDMNEIALRSQHEQVSFKTGAYMTEKDRPRTSKSQLLKDYIAEMDT